MTIDDLPADLARRIQALDWRSGPYGSAFLVSLGDVDGERRSAAWLAAFSAGEQEVFPAAWMKGRRRHARAA